jgi:hypothetical protein
LGALRNDAERSAPGASSHERIAGMALKLAHPKIQILRPWRLRAFPPSRSNTPQ